MKTKSLERLHTVKVVGGSTHSQKVVRRLTLLETLRLCYW